MGRLLRPDLLMTANLLYHIQFIRQSRVLQRNHTVDHEECSNHTICTGLNKGQPWVVLKWAFAAIHTWVCSTASIITSSGRSAFKPDVIGTRPAVAFPEIRVMQQRLPT